MSTTNSSVILERLKSLFPKSIDLTLDRSRRLLDDLGHPELQIPPVVHFAGTNGKGSILAMVRAGLEANGQKVHAYISPHLTKFHERIRLAGQLIDEIALIDVLQECEIINRKKPISLFEITTCAAMVAFARHEADYLLLEVGLGGRFDATNVVDFPRLTVISPISIDHQQYLGETIREIAREKAGILKPSVPCIVSKQPAEAMRVIKETAARIESPLFIQGVDWDVHLYDGGMRYEFSDEELLLPRPNLIGPHQICNAGAAVTILRHLGVKQPALSSALTDASWPARMQLLKSGPIVEAACGSEVWLDGGHNVAAGVAVARSLQELPPRNTRIICGMLNTKDIRSYLAAMRTAADKLYGVPIPGEGASLTASEVVVAANDVGFTAEHAKTAEEAARRTATEDPRARILICGSLYLAGTVLRDNV